MSTEAGYLAPTVTVATSLPKRALGAVLIVPVVTGPDGDGSATVVGGPFLDAEAIGEIQVSLRALGAKGGPEQVTRLHVPSLAVGSVLAVGLGADRDEWPADVIRRAAGVAARSLSGVETVITTLTELHLEAAIEGLILGELPVHRVPQRQDRAEGSGPWQDRRAEHRGRRQEGRGAGHRHRDGGGHRPRFRQHPAQPPVPWRIRQARQGFGRGGRPRGRGARRQGTGQGRLRRHRRGGQGLVAPAAAGAAGLPRRQGQEGEEPSRLVGKGITFDTGGISIKPAASMHHMTSDMGGAAAVIATVVLAAKQGLPIDVIATVPMAENMPSSTAQRPGDVLTQYGGITVEVLNTDAEGRLILADAIVRACEDDPDYLIETSTLTGAQTVALGARIPGVMGSDDFRDRVARISQDEGENGWAMPLPEELKDDLKSTVADLANVSAQRFAGMLVAGVYLREFVADGVQWVHIDVAGPAYNTVGPVGLHRQGRHRGADADDVRGAGGHRRQRLAQREVPALAQREVR